MEAMKCDGTLGGLYGASPEQLSPMNPRSALPSTGQCRSSKLRSFPRVAAGMSVSTDCTQTAPSRLTTLRAFGVARGRPPSQKSLSWCRFGSKAQTSARAAGASAGW